MYGSVRHISPGHADPRMGQAPPWSRSKSTLTPVYSDLSDFFLVLLDSIVDSMGGQVDCVCKQFLPSAAYALHSIFTITYNSHFGEIFELLCCGVILMTLNDITEFFNKSAFNRVWHKSGMIKQHPDDGDIVPSIWRIHTPSISCSNTLAHPVMVQVYTESFFVALLHVPFLSNCTSCPN